ncbi:MAG: signal peptidase II [Terriglobales bacterium]
MMDAETDTARREVPLRVMRIRHFVIALAVFTLDQLTKGWVEKMRGHASIEVIPNLFSIVHLENHGAAFGLFQDSPSQWKVGLLIAFSLLALAVVVILLWRGRNPGATGVALALIMGGACGNLFDRLLHGSVVDFLLFYVSRYEWPAFNVADSAIVVGAGLLVWDILRSEPQPAREAVAGQQ